MNSNIVQNIFCRIIYNLKKIKIKLDKFIWFKIIYLAKLKYHFSTQLINHTNASKISIKSCKAGNLNIFKIYLPDVDLIPICYKIALKNKHYKILSLFSGEQYYKMRINQNCRYENNLIGLYNPRRLEKEGFINIGKNGDISFIKYLFEDQNSYFDYNNTKYLIRGAALKGNTLALDILFDYLFDDLMNDDEPDKVFIRLCFKKIKKISLQKKNYKLFNYLITNLQIKIRNNLGY